MCRLYVFSKVLNFSNKKKGRSRREQFETAFPGLKIRQLDDPFLQEVTAKLVAKGFIPPKE